MTNTSTNTIVNFIDYMYSFYGKGYGIYASEYPNGGYTVSEIWVAVKKYIKTSKITFAGDSVDRENVRDILAGYKVDAL